MKRRHILALPLAGLVPVSKADAERLTAEDRLLSRAGFKNDNLKRIRLEWGSETGWSSNEFRADKGKPRYDVLSDPESWPGDVIRAYGEIWTCKGRVEYYEAPNGRKWTAAISIENNR